MNKIVVLAIALIIPSSVFAQSKFSVKGKITSGYKATRAAISYLGMAGYRSDTTSIKNGTFEFNGETQRPEMVELILIVPRVERAGNQKSEGAEDEESSSMKNVALFYSDGDMNITFDEKGIAKTIGGGNTQRGWNEYATSMQVQSKAQKEQFSFESAVAKFIRDNPDSYVSADLLEMFASGSSPKVFEGMYNSLSARMQSIPKVVGFKKTFEEGKEYDSGNKAAMDFTMNDTAGQPISLSSYKGRYVLLDFWASWCVPCRAENPNLVAAYEKFKNRNFEILAVSLDDKKDAWLKAIQEDKLSWKQISDLKGVDNEAAKLYNVSSIPQNFLIGPNGNIIGRNLRGEELEKRLAELIK